MRQDLLEERQGARVLRLAEPEHGLLAHSSIAVSARYLDEQRHALIPGKLAECEDSVFLDVGLRVVLDGFGNGSGSSLPRLLRQPKQRLPSHLGAGVVVGYADDRIHGLGSSLT